MPAYLMPKNAILWNYTHLNEISQKDFPKRQDGVVKKLHDARSLVFIVLHYLYFYRLFSIIKQMKERSLEKIIDIGLILSSETNLDTLFRTILKTSREITNADAGSIYIRTDSRLEFIASQNDTLEKRFKMDSARLFKPNPVPLTKENLSGYVALTGEILNIQDVYRLDSKLPYKHWDTFDRKFEYHTQSMLVIPLKDRDGEIIGVLQIINSMTPSGDIVSFSEEDVKLVCTLGSFAAIALKNALLAQSLKESHLSTIYRLVSAAEYKDPDTAHHLERMSNYSTIIAKHMGFNRDFQELVLYASPMHDIGKLGVPDAILGKPGPLDDDERRIMEKHTTIGADILKNPDSDVIKMARDIALSHHEKWDGEGYPKKLRGEEIPIEGRICSLSDVFDALSVKRVYKGPWPLDKVFTYIEEQSGKQFCPYVVEAFFKGREEILEIFNKYKE